MALHGGVVADLDSPPLIARCAGDALYPRLWYGLQFAIYPTVTPWNAIVGDAITNLACPGRYDPVNGPSAAPARAEREIGMCFDMSSTGTTEKLNCGIGSAALGVVRRGTWWAWGYVITGHSGQNTYIADWSTNGMALREEAGALTFFTYPGNHRVATSGTISMDTWHTVAGVMDQTHNRAYIDGAEVGTAAAVSNDLGTGANLYIGARGDLAGTEYFDGYIGAACMWTRNLAPPEIRLLHDDPYAPLRHEEDGGAYISSLVVKATYSYRRRRIR